MSKFIMFAVYDHAVEAYARPFIARSEGEALRNFTDERWNPQTPLYTHPGDYSLFQIGTYNDIDANLEPKVKLVARAHELPAQKQNDDDQQEVN